MTVAEPQCDIGYTVAPAWKKQSHPRLAKALVANKFRQSYPAMLAEAGLQTANAASAEGCQLVNAKLPGKIRDDDFLSSLQITGLCRANIGPQRIAVIAAMREKKSCHQPFFERPLYMGCRKNE